MNLPKYVIKRDGKKVEFDSKKILSAITKAFVATHNTDEHALKKAYTLTLEKISRRFGENGTPHVEEIQDLVEQSLVELNLYEVAKAYVLYRKQREQIREEKKRILGKQLLDEVDKSFSVNALRLLASRYLLKDESGKLIEGPKQLFQRVAALIAIADMLYDEEIYDKSGSQKVWQSYGLKPQKLVYKEMFLNEHHLERMHALYQELNSQGKMKLSWDEFLNWLQNVGFEKHYDDYKKYYELMVEKKFLPNSPTLFNAGTRLGQLSACFVLPIEDSIESIMDAAKQAAIIFKSGGGIGINYSALRPEGDIVASTGGVASGPVSFMRIIDTLTDVIKQGGKRRGANMGILEISHPDIEKFIKAKSQPGRFENFNISVLVTPEFWTHLESNEPWPLINPRDGSKWKEVDAKTLLDEIARMAWETGDPGLVFFDNINRYNPLYEHLGPIKATNPCGEEPLYPYESCNLGSINLYAFVKRTKNGVEFDWDSLKKAVEIATRFLDNVIDVNKYPVSEIERVTKQTRRIGLGLMGLADTLYALNTPYNSEEGFSFMSKVTEFVSYHSLRASVELAKARGAFPLFEKSDYAKAKLPFEGFYHREWWHEDWEALSIEIAQNGVRNSHTMTVAPTGSISMIAEVSSGLEPQFALVFEKHVTVGKFYYVDPEFERRIEELGLDKQAVIEEVAKNGGSVQGLNLPEDLRRVFVVAYDIPWWDHVRAQYEVQKWVSAAVSKTINMPSWVTPDDVLSAYVFAHRLGLKGITVYRDSSKGEQVLKTPAQRGEGYIAPVSNKTLELLREKGVELKRVKGKVEKRIPIIVTEEEKMVFSRCPVCGSVNLAAQEACTKCLDCGWSTCVIA